MSFKRISDNYIAWASFGPGQSPDTTCQRITKLEATCVNLQQQAALHFKERQKLQARLAHVTAKSNRRRKALRELNKAMLIAHLMVANQVRRNHILNEKLRAKPGILKRIWRVLW